MANKTFKTKIDINRKFGMLLTIRELKERSYKGKDNTGVDVWERQVECLCDCGNKINRDYRGLVKLERSGSISSCGCLKYHKKTNAIDKVEGFNLLSNEEKCNIISNLIKKGVGYEAIKKATSASNYLIYKIKKELNIFTYKIDNRIPIGEKFNRLTIISVVKEKNRRTKVHVLCDCGVFKTTTLHHIKDGSTKSCGCLGREVARKMMKEQLIPNNIKHADTKSGPHKYMNQLWVGMKQRCYNPNNKRYSTYGARGITVYEPWINDYLAFKEWILTNLGERYNANTGRRSDNESLDRIDVNQGYHPGNLRWATFVEQANNKMIKTIGHKTRPMLEKETGIKPLQAYKLQELYEKYHNTKVKKGNVVHHINWNGIDNRKSNLIEVTRIEHGWLHQISKYDLRTKSRKELIKILKNVDWGIYYRQKGSDL